MSDIACWRQGDAFIVRYYGNEFMMTKDDCHDMVYHITQVIQGASESFGVEYIGLIASSRRQQLYKANSPKTRVDLSGILEALDLEEKPKFRRI